MPMAAGPRSAAVGGALPFDRSEPGHLTRPMPSWCAARLGRCRTAGGDRSRRPPRAGVFGGAVSIRTGIGPRCGSVANIAPTKTTRFTAPAGCCWPIGIWGNSTPRRPAVAWRGWSQVKTLTGVGARGPPRQTPGKPAPSTVEETAIALQVLLAAADDKSLKRTIEAAVRGRRWPSAPGSIAKAAPIGFYFAKLWYYERAYPLVFAVAALGTAVRRYPTP